MLLPVYIHVVPTWDRPFLSTKPPSDQVLEESKAIGGRLFVVELELPGFAMVDGTVRAVATLVDQTGIRLPDPTKPV